MINIVFKHQNNFSLTFNLLLYIARTLNVPFKIVLSLSKNMFLLAPQNIKIFKSQGTSSFLYKIMIYFRIM